MQPAQHTQPGKTQGLTTGSFPENPYADEALSKASSTVFALAGASFFSLPLSPSFLGVFFPPFSLFFDAVSLFPWFLSLLFPLPFLSLSFLSAELPLASFFLSFFIVFLFFFVFFLPSLGLFILLRRGLTIFLFLTIVLFLITITI